MSLQLLEQSQAVQLVQEGQVIAYPTEAVYGLGCDPMNEQAVATLLALKQRDRAKGLIVIGFCIEQFDGLIQSLTTEQLQPALDTWPGPFTWLLPAGKACPKWLRGAHETIAIRISNHPVCRGLSQLLGGPLVSTSANPWDQAPARTIDELEQYFHDGLAGVVRGELGGLNQPTTIRDLGSGHVIRGKKYNV